MARLPRVGFRHWHDVRTDGQTVPTVYAGGCLHHAEVRGDRAWACPQPALFRIDGWRGVGDERDGPRLACHGEATSPRRGDGGQTRRPTSVYGCRGPGSSSSTAMDSFSW